MGAVADTKLKSPTNHGGLRWLVRIPFQNPPVLPVTQIMGRQMGSFHAGNEQHLFRLQPPTSAEAGEKTLRKILLKVTRRNVTREKIPDYTPGLSQRSGELIRTPEGHP